MHRGCHEQGISVQVCNIMSPYRHFITTNTNDIIRDPNRDLLDLVLRGFSKACITAVLSVALN